MCVCREFGPALLEMAAACDTLLHLLCDTPAVVAAVAGGPPLAGVLLDAYKQLCDMLRVLCLAAACTGQRAALAEAGGVVARLAQLAAVSA